jgi:hypothetical protein
MLHVEAAGLLGTQAQSLCPVPQQVLLLHLLFA